MEQITSGGHSSSSNHLLYSLQQPRPDVTLLANNINNNNPLLACYLNGMEMSALNGQRPRLNAQQLNPAQHQQCSPTNPEQIHCSFSEMISDGITASEWQQFAAQNGHLMTANRVGVDNFKRLSEGSALREMLGGSLSSPVTQQQNQLKNVPNLQNGWPNLSNNGDNIALPNRGGGNNSSSMPLAAPACLTPFSSDPGFVERAAKFSSFNGNGNTGISTCQKVSTEETAASTLEFVSGAARNMRETACSNDSDAAKTIRRTGSCPPVVENVADDTEKLTNVTDESALSDKVSAGDAKFPSENAVKKRKSDRYHHGTPLQNIKMGDSEEFKEKKSKAVDVGVKEKENMKTKGEQSNSDNSVESIPKAVNENSKPSENQKHDYIHVRARRGQATDSHSLAERVRREKISERMKYLQDLVPGCNKVTGKAVMLDEIINYVQSLQRQVERTCNKYFTRSLPFQFLSMKLAAVNPRLDFNIDNFFAKEDLAKAKEVKEGLFVNCVQMPPCGNFSSMGVSPDLTQSSYLQFQQLQQTSLQAGGCCGLDVPSIGSAPDTTTLHRTMSAPVSAEMLVDTNFHGHAPSVWDSELQNLFNMGGIVQGRQSPFASQGIPGHLEVNHMKMEM
eukprot:Gb_24992 [translate_table: standard]